MTSNTPRKVCAVLVDRANYGRLKPVLNEIRTRPELQLQLIATGATNGHEAPPIINNGNVYPVVYVVSRIGYATRITTFVLLANATGVLIYRLASRRPDRNSESASAREYR